MELKDIFRHSRKTLASLYERCQKLYFAEHGFYYLRAQTASASRINKASLARMLHALGNECGWNNGTVMSARDYGQYLAQTRIRFSSLDELGLKLAARGY